MRSTLLAVLICLPVPVYAGAPTLRQMQEVYRDLNEICRGGSGDHEETNMACDVRSKVDKLIAAMGGKAGR